MLIGSGWKPHKFRALKFVWERKGPSMQDASWNKLDPGSTLETIRCKIIGMGGAWHSSPVELL